METKSIIGISASSAVLAPNPGYNPQRADSAKHKARSKHERKIECPSLKRLHDRDLLRSFSVIRSLLLCANRRTFP
jgi:hypothetical protein